MIIGGDSIKDKAMFKIVGYANHAQDPLWFTTAPIESAKKCLKKANLQINQIDLFEVNEAFAYVALAYVRELELDKEKVNIYGSGISLGHPIGASWNKDFNVIDDGLEREK